MMAAGHALAQIGAAWVQREHAREAEQARLLGEALRDYQDQDQHQAPGEPAGG